jgi:hypothetical protein
MSQRRRASRRLVIDADIARAAGGVDAVYPTSKNCRDFLEAVRIICHRLVMSNAISVEWKRHESRFTSTWLNKMYGMRKVVFIDPAKSTSEDLGQQLEKMASSEKAREAVLKDAHPLEAALASDQIVASMDETVRDLFSRASKNIGEIRPVVWVNPNREEEKITEWLENGFVGQSH